MITSLGNLLNSGQPAPLADVREVSEYEDFLVRLQIQFPSNEKSKPSASGSEKRTSMDYGQSLHVISAAVL